MPTPHVVVTYRSIAIEGRALAVVVLDRVFGRRSASRRAPVVIATTAIAALALGPSGGCRTVPATQVIVFVHATPSTAALASELRVRVLGATGTEPLLDITTPLPDPVVGPLARVPVVPEDGDPSRTFRVVAELEDDADATVVSISASASTP